MDAPKNFDPKFMDFLLIIIINLYG